MAVLVLLAAAAVVFLHPEWQISLGSRSLQFQHIREAAAGGPIWIHPTCLYSPIFRTSGLRGWLSWEQKS